MRIINPTDIARVVKTSLGEYQVQPRQIIEIDSDILTIDENLLVDGDKNRLKKNKE